MWIWIAYRDKVTTDYRGILPNITDMHAHTDSVCVCAHVHIHTFNTISHV